MKRLIVSSQNQNTISLSDIDNDKFFVALTTHNDKILFVPTKFQSKKYFARQLNNSFAYGNGYGHNLEATELTISEWISFFKTGSNKYYQFDTLHEVFEFAFNS